VSYSSAGNSSKIQNHHIAPEEQLPTPTSAAGTAQNTSTWSHSSGQLHPISNCSGCSMQLNSGTNLLAPTSINFDTVLNGACPADEPQSILTED
jgi:hypothetical protein